jgi:hypothetical protein
MKKKQHANIPDFSSRKPQQPGKPPMKAGEKIHRETPKAVKPPTKARTGGRRGS